MWFEAVVDNKQCPICGKPLQKNRSDWGWRFDGKSYCSYSCMMKADKRYKQSKEYNEIQTELTGYKQSEKNNYNNPPDRRTSV